MLPANSESGSGATMADHLITVDRNTYEALQEELKQLRQLVADEEQKVSQEQMRLFMEYTPAAIAVFDREMRYLLASRRWRENLGLGNQDIIGHSHYEFCSEVSPFWQTIHQRCLSGAIEKCDEDAFIRLDGTTDWVRWEIHPWYEYSGAVGGTVMFTEVITKRKQAEIALANSERRLQDIANNLPGAIYQFTYCDGVWRIDYVSDFIWELAGITALEMMEDIDCFFAIIHPEDIQSTIASIMEAIENVTPWHYEGRLVKPNGEIRWWQGDSTPTKNHQGEVIFCGVMLDITERKQAEAELKRLNEELETRVEERTKALLESEARLQRLADNVPGMLYEFHLQPDGTQFFSYVSSGCQDITGRSAEELENDSSISLADIHPEDLPHVQIAMSVSAQTLQKFEHEWRVISTTGEQRWVRAVSKPERRQEGEVVWYGYLLDITAQQAALRDRQQAEQKLQQQAQFLQSIWEGVDYGICVLDVLDDGADFRLVRFNPAMLKNSLIPLEACLDKKITEVFPEEMANRYLQHYKDCIQSKKSIFFEESFRYEEVETWWLINATPLWDDNSRISQIVVTSTEITEPKKAEQERQLFVSVIENSSDFIGFATLEGKPIFLNEAGKRMVGLEHPSFPEDLKISEFFFSEDREYVQQSIIPKVIKYGMWEEEIRFRHFQTGAVINVDYNMFILKNSETNEPLYFATITRDIRERKQAEAALRESQHLIQRIANSTPNLIYIFDLEEQRNVYANRELYSLVGYSVEEVQKMGDKLLFNILHPEDLAKIAIYHQKFLTANDGDIVEFEFRVQDKNNEWCWLYSRETPFNRNADGKVKQILGVSTNITERKRAEIKLQQQAESLENTVRELQLTQAQLIQSEKMSSLGNMVAGVAHEINNPVNFIHGNLIPASEYAQDLLRLVGLYQIYYPYPPEEIQETLIDIEFDFLKEDLVKLLKSMRVGTQRIREIVLSLRNFSRLDEAEFKDVDIHEGIDSTLMILHNRLKSKPDHPEILVIKEYGELPLVECYPGQLNQVFMNILSNAIDALESLCMSEQGQITIRTEVIHSNWVRISIADNGTGIPATVVSKLFDPFFTTKSVGKGTGLGLSISYQIVVDKHKGKLYCHSEPGNGAEFVIEIPITQAAG
ncbi:PAS domain S-box protein [Aliinostoc sp. HNIBRCY26]|uniref:PAS domain S-box protein n=1 Tax=Aliinostoc sp. HNIBRCY26 TaxID=3418997 RepID=UPI003CFEA47C